MPIFGLRGAPVLEFEKRLFVINFKLSGRYFSKKYPCLATFTVMAPFTVECGIQRISMRA